MKDFKQGIGGVKQASKKAACDARERERRGKESSQPPIVFYSRQK
jgi:hypothetical protein